MSWQEAKTSSDRTFGLTFAAVFVALPLVLWWRRGALSVWPFGIAAAFLLVAVLRPTMLGPLNQRWTRFGLLLARVTNPLVMGLVFYVVVTPMAIALRLCGKRPLLLGFDSAIKSYWIERRPPGPPPETMANQF